MNRIFLSIAVLILLACNRVESFDVSGNFNPELPFEISVSAVPSTKGELVENPEDMGSIGLFCALTGNDPWSETTEFSKLYDRCFNVTSDGDWIIDGESESWGYESMTDKYTAFAYSPYSGVTEGITPRIEDGELVIDYIVPTNSADQPDLMYALPQKDIYPQVIGSIPLKFYHALASISFSVVSSVDLKIIAVDIADVINEGSLTWDYTNNKPQWSLGDYTYEEFTVDLNIYTPDQDTEIQLNSEQGNLMMIPQQLADGAEVRLTLSNYEQKSLVIPSGTEWEAGEKYHYVIKLDDGGGGFIFNSKQISNCYIINPTAGEDTIVQIPIEDRINDFWMNYGGKKKAVLDSDTAFSELYVEEIWEDFSGSVKFSSEILRDAEGKLAVKLTIPAINQTGNFVFSINEDQAPLWSWHLWFTDYDPDAIAAANRYNIQEDVDMKYTLSGYNGAVHRYTDDYNSADSMHVWSGIYKDKFIMDRNIGERDEYAADYGAGAVYYQFGRKDPFPGDGGSIKPGVRNYSGFSFANAVQLPSDFFISSSSSSDNWCGEDAARHARYIWFDEKILNMNYSKGKSIFDPSPLGWRVPVSATWRSFNTTISDVESCNAIESVGKYSYYGYRDPNNKGGLSQAQVQSYVWSANPFESESGYCFLYSDDAVTSPDYLIMTYGLPIRAIQE